MHEQARVAKDLFIERSLHYYQYCCMVRKKLQIFHLKQTNEKEGQVPQDYSMKDFKTQVGKNLPEPL